MKKILSLIASVLVAVTAFADTSQPIYQPTPTNHVCLAGRSCSPLVDVNGRFIIKATLVDPSGTSLVLPVSSGTLLPGIASWNVGGVSVAGQTATTGSTVSTVAITSIGTVAVAGDVLQVAPNSTTAALRRQWVTITGVSTNSVTVSPSFTTPPVNGDTFFLIRPVPIFASSASGQNGNALMVNIDSAYQNATATGLLKNEDSGVSSTDAGVGILVKRTDTAAVQTDANNEYILPVTNSFGAFKMDLDATFQSSTTNSPLQLEDVGIAESSAIMMAGARMLTTLGANPGTAGDGSFLNVDPLGRLFVNPYGAAQGDTWSSCSASNTGTSDIAIKAGVASNRLYVTSISCYNTAAVASAITFKDGSTAIYGGGISNSTLTGVAYYEHSLPVPLRTAVAAAFNFAMTTNATATTCCAAGYQAVN